MAKLKNTTAQGLSQAQLAALGAAVINVSPDIALLAKDTTVAKDATVAKELSLALISPVAYGHVTNWGAPTILEFWNDLTAAHNTYTNYLVVFLDGPAAGKPYKIHLQEKLPGADCRIEVGAIDGHPEFPAAPVVGNHFVILRDFAGNIEDVVGYALAEIVNRFLAVESIMTLLAVTVDTAPAPGQLQFTVDKPIQANAIIKSQEQARVVVNCDLISASHYLVTVWPPFDAAPTGGAELSVYLPCDDISAPQVQPRAFSILPSDTVRAINESMVENTCSGSGPLFAKSIQLVIPPMPNCGALPPSTLYGLKVKYLTHFTTGGSGNSYVKVKAADGTVLLTTVAQAIVADTPGAISHTLYQNLFGLPSYQPLLFEVWIESTSANPDHGCYCQYMTLCYDIIEIIPGLMINQNNLHED
jgi:hypothetical protein